MKKEFVEKPHFEKKKKKKKKKKKRKKNLNIVTIMVENFSNLVMLKLKNRSLILPKVLPPSAMWILIK